MATPQFGMEKSVDLENADSRRGTSAIGNVASVAVATQQFGTERVFMPRFPLHIIPCAIGNAAPSDQFAPSELPTSPVTSDGGSFLFTNS